MGSRWQQDYEIEYYQTLRSRRGRSDDFYPSIKCLKTAENIARHYEERRGGAAKRYRDTRDGIATLGASVADNIVQFHSPDAAGASSTLRGQPYWTPYRLSPAPRARRGARQSEARRGARSIRAAPSPLAALKPVAFDDLQDEMWGGFGLLAVQALAVLFGLSGLLALLTLI
jgi:hypothetical protein